jgi:Ca2+-binding EF-hand superfamily protein
VTPKPVVVVIAGVVAVAIMTVGQKASVPKQPDKTTQAQQNVRELLLLMDTDKNGKISKQEWMKFMETEFDKLDRDKTGELDRKELLQSELMVKHPRAADVGK